MKQNVRPTLNHTTTTTFSFCFAGRLFQTLTQDRLSPQQSPHRRISGMKNCCEGFLEGGCSFNHVTKSAKALKEDINDICVIHNGVARL